MLISLKQLFWIHLSDKIQIFMLLRSVTRLLWPSGGITFPWFFMFLEAFHCCLCIWSSNHLLQSLLTMASKLIFKFCFKGTLEPLRWKAGLPQGYLIHEWLSETCFPGLPDYGQEGLELVHSAQLGLKFLCPLPDTSMGGIPPRLLSVWCETAQFPKSHFCPRMDAELLLRDGTWQGMFYLAITRMSSNWKIFALRSQVLLRLSYSRQKQSTSSAVYMWQGVTPQWPPDCPSCVTFRFVQCPLKNVS